jgi:hypothetical protein
MKRYKEFFGIACLALIAACSFGADPNAGVDIKYEWPRQRVVDGTKLIMYQPQIESWDNNRLKARAVIASSPQDSNQVTYGVVFFEGQTDINKEQRLVNFASLDVTKVTCPTAPDKEAQIKAMLQKVMPGHYSTSLDHLELSLAMSQAQSKAKSVPVKNDVPKIFYSTEPALLVLIDGQPAMKEDQSPKLKRIINTQPLLLYDEPAKLYYLRFADKWAQSHSLDGPWALATMVPEKVNDALRQATDDNNVDLLKIVNTGGGKSVPKIFVSTSPAELIVTNGEPNMQSITGTNLMYVANTSSDIIIDSSSKEFYFLTSGRWFKGSTLEGPWTFVPGSQLPSEFKKIPAESPRGAVLASIPGTPQANESLIANSIPQTAVIKKSQAKFKPVFDGNAQFASIEGTNLKYAKNSPIPIIDVPGNTYYALNDGVWFKARNLNDTWAVADSVPETIYSIPPSSPVYYATYVQDYGSNDDSVTFGYTPGYYGTVVSDGTVVYGTGYTYQPWIGSTWYGAPATYGCGVAFGYHPAYGWTFGYDTTRAGTSPWWGPMAYGWNGSSVSRYHWNGYGGWGGASTASVYHRWGDAVAGGSRAAWYNPWTGNVGVAGRGAGYNTATGNYAAGRGAAVYNPSTGSVTTAHQGVSGNMYAGGATATHGESVSTAAHTNNLYAGSNGQIYRNESGNFQHLEAGGAWTGATADRNMAAEQNIRAQSEMRQSAYNSSGRAGYGGGYRGRR